MIINRGLRIMKIIVGLSICTSLSTITIGLCNLSKMNDKQTDPDLLKYKEFVEKGLDREMTFEEYMKNNRLV